MPKNILNHVRRYVDPFRVTKGKDFRLKDFDPDNTLGLKMDKREASFIEICCTAASAPGPNRRISPMWLTSKMPTPVRTALCSAMMPPTDGYSTGMSQPLKSTILAPAWRWTAFRAVLRIMVDTSTAGNESSIGFG